MKRSELIAFVSWLDEGTGYFGNEFLQKKVDEWLGANKASKSCKHIMRNYITEQLFMCYQCGETTNE